MRIERAGRRLFCSSAAVDVLGPSSCVPTTVEGATVRPGLRGRSGGAADECVVPAVPDVGFKAADAVAHIADERVQPRPAVAGGPRVVLAGRQLDRAPVGQAGWPWGRASRTSSRRRSRRSTLRWRPTELHRSDPRTVLVRKSPLVATVLWPELQGVGLVAVLLAPAVVGIASRDERTLGPSAGGWSLRYPSASPLRSSPLSWTPGAGRRVSWR